ncbi:MAG TPA: hypothetical protein VFB31_08585 [Pseudolabrys sp.]|nr:hypothetical protein [Pseudolabrys sp.]
MGSNIPDLLSSIAAIVALAIASYGLVDAASAFWGGPLLFGYGRIKVALAPFDPALQTLGNAAWQTFHANWLNNVPLADQKAAAKSIINLTMAPENASALAGIFGLDKIALKAAIIKKNKGSKLTSRDVKILERFDALAGTIVDAAYERADQVRRGGLKLLTAEVAMTLAPFADIAIKLGSSNITVESYLASRDFLIAILVGAVAAPLAVIFRDHLPTLLTISARALGRVKG